jgi:hypothetical protein
MVPRETAVAYIDITAAMFDDPASCDGNDAMLAGLAERE